MEPMTQQSGTPPLPPSGPRAVVAAVIEREGRFLAARRIGPAALAGRWEFPGGKVEPDEDDAAALRRECLEELGVRIEVGEAIGPEYTAAGGALLVRTYLATLLAGEPAPIEGHDELRWLTVGQPQVRELPWLEGDYLVLDALEARACRGTQAA